MATQRRPASRKSIAHLPGADSNNIGYVSDNKENATTDLGAVSIAKSAATTSVASPRKTRSKSMGPGGLDALKEDAGNRRKRSTAPPKSILKPSIPLSPLKEIPSRKLSTPEPASSPSKSPQRRPQSPAKIGTPVAKLRSPVKEVGSSHRIEITTPSPSKSPGNSASPSRRNTSQAESDNDEAKEQRRMQREEIQKQRELRRKSMANRRVSFAPEATLHTWDHVEDLQDSTTSSASTDATRRASALSTTQEDGEEPPSTPSEQADEDFSQTSPSPERGLRRMQRQRRSSGIPPMNFNNPNDAFSSSPFSAAPTPAPQKATENQPDSSPASDSGSTEPDSSPLRADVHREGSNGQANAGSGDDDDDDDGEMSMEMAADDVTAAFKPFAQQAWNPRAASAKPAVVVDQENVDPFSPAFARGTSSSQQISQNDDSGEMSMDITRAVGGIVPQQNTQGLLGRHVNISPMRGQSVRSRRRSSGGSSAVGGQTMDFTTAVGGIRSGGHAAKDASQIDENEELSMEFTSVFGGIQGKNNRQSLPAHSPSRQLEFKKHLPMEDHDADGDVMMTNTSLDFVQLDQTGQNGDMEMDMTKAVGGILSTTGSSTRNQAIGTSSTSPSRFGGAKSPMKATGSSPKRPWISASATGSPALIRTLQAQPGRGTPMKSPQTPSKQITPQPARPTTPGKTPPSKNVTMRQPSPRQLFRHEINQAKNSPLAENSKIFTQSAERGAYTPSVVLAPKSNSPRRVSGVGFDKEGLGSPRVAALLDRRTSIGERADVFAPQAFESREVRFQDPRVLEAEVTREREDDVRRESGQFIMETEAGAVFEDKDVTTSLKEAIGSMTPKKNKPRPRKSLAVGAAKGLLGKRPLELDEDDDDGTPQGLRGREASPVKKIRLQAPPSALETTGRPMARRQSMGAGLGMERPHTPMASSPVKRTAVTTPSHKGHFKDAEALASAQKPLPVLGQTEPSDGVELGQVEQDERIRLQDFLNMTNIRFMELNTTKRRYTVAPSATPGRNDSGKGEHEDPDKAFEDAVVAGACTLPMLELYQHSCRELKKYISEGRKIVREIEVNTYEDNPALFREYLSASPDDRAIMDNQFKNMKTHARLVSKGMWYEWRMKLLEGLKGVLVNEVEGLDQDGRQLEEDENAIVHVLPHLLAENDQLSQECAMLQERAEELADCDQNELKEARQQILSIDDQLRQRRHRIDMLQKESEELDTAIEDAVDAKSETTEAIKEARRVLEEFRGWSAGEVNKFKGEHPTSDSWRRKLTRTKENVDAIEAEHGWTITTSSATQVTLVYRGQLQLFFDVSCFMPRATFNDQSRDESGPISLTYVGDSKEYRPLPLTTEKRFFLQLMRAHLQCVDQSATRVQDLLEFVSAGWTQALAVADEIKRLDLGGVTESRIVGDERLLVSFMMLLPAVKTKIDVGFEIGATAQSMAVAVKLKIRAGVVYGQEYSSDKMKDFLRSKIGEGLGRPGTWADAVGELKKKLVAQGRK